MGIGFGLRDKIEELLLGFTWKKNFFCMSFWGADFRTRFAELVRAAVLLKRFAESSFWAPSWETSFETFRWLSVLSGWAIYSFPVFCFQKGYPHLFSHSSILSRDT